MFDYLRITPQSFGAFDFVAYWSAFKLFIFSKNPYDPELLLSLQSSVGYLNQAPMMSWPPPWLFLIMFPVLLFSFSHSVLCWLFINIILSFVCFYLILKINKLKFNFLNVFLVALSSIFPIFQTISIGQTSIVLLLFLLLFIFYFISEKYFYAGLFIPGILIKPHLFYLFLLLLIFSCFKREFIKIFCVFLGAFISFSVLIVLIMLINQEAIYNWMICLVSEIPGVSKPQDHITPTIPGALRALFLGYGYSDFQLFSIIIPSFAVVLFGFYVLRCSAFNWGYLLPLSTALGLLTSPYAWICDFSLLAINTGQLLKIKNEDSQSIASFGLIIIILIQVVSLMLSISYFRYHDNFWWLSIFVFLVWNFSMISSNKYTRSFLDKAK